jgi:hypothetical protein
MRLRHMGKADLERCVAIETAAFMEDPDTAYMFPRRHEYPQAIYKENFRKRRSIFAESQQGPRIKLVVAETEPSDDIWTGQPEIVGYVQWFRRGNDAAGSYSGPSRPDSRLQREYWYHIISSTKDQHGQVPTNLLAVVTNPSSAIFYCSSTQQLPSAGFRKGMSYA